MSNNQPSPELEQEIAFFEEQKQNLLLHHANKFALIHQQELLGIFDTAEAAYEFGVNRYGFGPFLVRKIQAEQEESASSSLMHGLIHAHL